MGPDSGTITSSEVLIGHRHVDHFHDSHDVFIKDAFIPPCHFLVGGSITIDWNLVDRLAIESAPSLLVTSMSQMLSQARLVGIMFSFLDMLIQELHVLFFNLHLQ